MASAPAHVSTASALTKQKLLQNIQMKEQQKLLENVLTQQLGSGSSHELLAQALKNIIPQVQVRAYLLQCVEIITIIMKPIAGRIILSVAMYVSYTHVNNSIVHWPQVTGDEDSDGDQPEVDPSTNKPVFLVPTDSPGRRSDSS